MGERDDVDRGHVAPGIPFVAGLRHGANPFSQAVCPGPVAPLLGIWLGAPGGLLRLIPRLKNAHSVKLTNSVPSCNSNTPQSQLPVLSVQGTMSVWYRDQR